MSKKPAAHSGPRSRCCSRKHNRRRTGQSSRSSFLLREPQGEACVMIAGSPKGRFRPHLDRLKLARIDAPLKHCAQLLYGRFAALCGGTEVRKSHKLGREEALRLGPDQDETRSWGVYHRVFQAHRNFSSNLLVIPHRGNPCLPDTGPSPQAREKELSKLSNQLWAPCSDRAPSQSKIC